MQLGHCVLCQRHAGPGVEFYLCPQPGPCHLLLHLVCGSCFAAGRDTCPECGARLMLDPLAQHTRDMRHPLKRLRYWWQVRAQRRRRA